MNTDLQNYIDQARKQGTADEQIRQGLLQSGWSMNDINEALMRTPLAGSSRFGLRMRMPKFLITTVIVMVVGVGGYLGGAYYMTNYQSFPLWPFEVGVPIPTFTPRPSPKVSVLPEQVGITDCGETSSVSNECFNSKFEKCEPAKFTLAVGSSSTYYEITSPNGNYCFVKAKAMQSLNSSWINKEMLCSLDPKKGFETATEDMSHCAGELYDLIIGK